MSTYVNNLSFIQPIENQAVLADGGALLYTAPAGTFARVQVFVGLGEDIIFNPVNVEIKIAGQVIFQQDGGPFFAYFTNIKLNPGDTVEMFVDGSVSFVLGTVTGASFTTEIDY